MAFLILAFYCFMNSFYSLPSLTIFFKFLIIIFYFYLHKQISYLSRFSRINVYSTVGLLHVLRLSIVINVFCQFVFLFLQYCYPCLKSNVFFICLVQVLFQLKCLWVQALLVLVDFFWKDSGEVICCQIWFHQFDVLAICSSWSPLLILKIRLTALAPVATMAGFCGLRSSLKIRN